MMANDGGQLELATEVTIAWLSNPHTRAQAEDVSAMLGSLLSALRGLGEPPADAETSASSARSEHTPAVTKRQSLASPDRIISMIDGKPYRSLKRHLKGQGLTPDEYRQRYGLKPDYPMIAPGYSAARSAAAKQHGFGRKPVAAAASEPAAEVAPEPQGKAAPGQPLTAKRRRLGISGAKQAAKAHLGGGEGEAASKPEGQ